MLRGGAYILILCAVGLALLAGSIGGAWERFPTSAYEAALEPARPGQENSIKRAVFAADNLWLLSDSGELWTVGEFTRDAQRQKLQEPASDICVQNGAPVIVTAPRAGASVWTLRRRVGAQWTTVGTTAIRQEGLVGLFCAADSLLVLTSQRLIEVRGAHQSALNLSNRVPSRPISVSLATPTQLFVGQNAGEWGGGLQSIDRRTGQVRAIEGNVSGELCGGPLNADCDPVNGLAPVPWKPGCVVAAVGLIHMSSHGRLVEVCNDLPKRLHYEPCPSRAPEPKTQSKSDEPFCTEAFFGVVAKRDALMALRTAGITTLDREGNAARTSLPAFKPHGPFEVSFTPDAVFVRSSANERQSLSGPTPLMVSR